MLKRFLLFLYLLSTIVAYAIPASTVMQVGKLVNNANRVQKVSRSLFNVAGALSKSRICELAEIAKSPNGLKRVGEILGKEKLSTEVLENAYLRIAVQNRVITEDIAENTFKNLSGVDGFRALARKINIANDATSKGHLYEMLIGNAAAKRGFKVVSFGLKYDDELKMAETDMDILLSKGNKLFAIESKNYSGLVPMDMVRADTASLLSFSKGMSKTKEVISIFSFSTRPSKSAIDFLKSRNVYSIVGTPEDIALKMEHISQCLD